MYDSTIQKPDAVCAAAVATSATTSTTSAVRLYNPIAHKYYALILTLPLPFCATIKLQNQASQPTSQRECDN